MEYSSSPLHTFPSSLLAQSDIWSESTRTRLKHPRYKKRDLDERKTKVSHLFFPAGTEKKLECTI